MTKRNIKTFAAIAFTAAALTTVAAAGNASAGEYGHDGYRYRYGYGRHYGYDHDRYYNGYRRYGYHGNGYYRYGYRRYWSFGSRMRKEPARLIGRAGLFCGVRTQLQWAGLAGELRPPAAAQGVSLTFDGPTREHSRKPDEFYQLVVDRTNGFDRCDLFSRETRPGFDGWGREHGRFDQVAWQTTSGLRWWAEARRCCLGSLPSQTLSESS
jgi:hypothetical protein